MTKKQVQKRAKELKKHILLLSKEIHAFASDLENHVEETYDDKKSDPDEYQWKTNIYDTFFGINSNTAESITDLENLGV